MIYATQDIANLSARELDLGLEIRSYFGSIIMFYEYDIMNKKEQGAYAENIAQKWLEDSNRSIIERNWTMRGGEIDIIATYGEYIVCVEVKSVVIVEDIMAYITDKKLSHLKRAFKTYLHLHPTDLQPRMDVIFVKDDAVREVYENVTNN